MRILQRRGSARMVALIAFSTMGVAASGAELIRLDGARRDAAGIRTMAVEAPAGGAAPGMPAQVTIPAPQLRAISAPLAGLVDAVHVASSQQVRRGQLLVRLTSPGLADVQHTYLQASAQHQLAAAALERDERLHAEGIIALARLEAARSRQQEVAADLAERTQALRAAGMSAQAIAALRAGRAVGSAIDLVAPIDGVVLEQTAIPGQRVEAAAVLMRIARLDPLWLEIQVPVERLGGIAPGAEVRVPASGAGGRVIALGRSVAAPTQTVTVRAELREGAARLRPGQLVEAVIDAPPGRGTWQVPAAALARSGARTVVYVETADGFVAQPVQVLQERGATALIGAPFKGGERIAVGGVAALKAMQAGIGGAR
ncbi:MAG: efflux RND transporter periplasmic adaptor subunit [Burkholderiales bacterium]|nr:efflux RND transporter periplasmic adaptor subunit [Burkholderiales bacterium]